MAAHQKNSTSWSYPKTVGTTMTFFLDFSTVGLAKSSDSKEPKKGEREFMTYIWRIILYIIVIKSSSVCKFVYLCILIVL